MRTLFIERIYLNGHGGGVNCARAYINALAEISDEFTLVYPLKPGKDAEYLSEKVTTLYPVDFNKPKVTKLVRLLRGKINPFDKLPDDLFEKGRFDVVVFSSSYAVQGLFDRFKATGAKIVTLHHNFELDYLRDNTHMLLKPFMYAAVKNSERKAVRHSDLNLCLTRQDIRLLTDYYQSKSRFVNTSVFEYKPNAPKPITKDGNCGGKTFIITGDLSFRQSNNSIMPWIDEYYPILKAACPEAHLIIAGRNPSAELIEKAKETGIEIVASPKDMDEVLCRGDYYICPVSMGGGLKLRAMDGLKWGMPILAHEVSSHGYETLMDKGVFLAYDSPESFKSQVDKLLSANIKKTDVIAAYQDAFSFDNGIERLRTVLKQEGIHVN